jgi:hypothetical protein
MKRIALPMLLLPLFTLACGGFFSEGGIGGTGVTEGPITAFGSIFVNGIEWEIDDAEIELDGLVGDESALAIGMVVRVEGTLDRASGRGVASQVRFDDDIEGPVGEIVDVGVEGDLKQLEILDQLVLIEFGQTVFDGADPGFDFDTLDTDDVIEVSGLVDDEGVIHATYVHKKGLVEIGETEVELSGLIAGYLGGDSFVLGNVLIRFDPTGVETDLTDLPGGLEDGLAVEVKGVLQAADRVYAARIEGDAPEPEPEGEDVSTHGFVRDFESLSDFRLPPNWVDASEAEFDGGDASELENGVRIEVVGFVADGVLIAERVTFIDRWLWDDDDDSDSEADLGVNADGGSPYGPGARFGQGAPNGSGD